MGRRPPPRAPRARLAGRRLIATPVLLDTNVLIRHLTGEPTAQAARAARAGRLLASDRALCLVDLVAAEVVYALESF